MPEKRPHISLPQEQLVPRVLGFSPRDLESWPENLRELVSTMAAELFLVRYNPFINASLVRASVDRRLADHAASLPQDFARALSGAVAAFWRGFHDDQRFRDDLVRRLKAFMPEAAISTNPYSLIESSTDATDLRMELPMLMVSPETTQQVQGIVRLANDLGFSIVPRGGGTGLTGGAVPGRPRTVILSLSRFKKIFSVDEDNLVLHAQAGVITLDAIKAAAAKGLLFTVDPASKSASSLGGNISENSGGPNAFEYGTTLDNIHSYRMVLPDGEIRDVARRDHPRHKILPGESAVFEIRDEAGTLVDTVVLPGDEIRAPGLGKDVSNKTLGGLPGVQKEGVDGIITECRFILYPRPALSRTLCLEFYGQNMRNAMLVIMDIVKLRDRIRAEGDLVKISSLEEFGPKYVKAIEYTKKSGVYEGEPISVLLIQLDSDHEQALEATAATIADIARPFENVDVFMARDQAEADLFWEDRHKLSAISKRTSGFKINEDVVIPLETIPEFSDFLEDLNLEFLARAYRKALQKVSDLNSFTAEDRKFVDQELDHAARVMRQEITHTDTSEQEYLVQTAYFFRHLETGYPEQEKAIGAILDNMLATRIEIANHMHAGDGNCHVNIPVNSADPEMLAQAHQAAEKVFKKVLELQGGVSGEHGIGITKIDFLEAEKIEALKSYKAKIDPNGILNPGKLVKREMDVKPYTFSFNALIQDLDRTALPDKGRLIRLLANIQFCTRCGKCKGVCPMYYPEAGLLYHPRNKNITLGALLEALYYSLRETGKPDPRLMDQLRGYMEHCTACGKCTSVCPVKIQSADVALSLRAFLEEKGSGGHKVKRRTLDWLSRDPARRAPRTAKFMAAGQALHGSTMGLVPASWRSRMANPVLAGPNPALAFRNLAEILELSAKGFIFQARRDARGNTDEGRTVLYFPGCGAGLFTPDIGLAGLYLLLATGNRVILPPRHLCCGYPLLSQGLEQAYLSNRQRAVRELKDAFDAAATSEFAPRTLLTACGSCRDALSRFGLDEELGVPLTHKDVTQHLMAHLPELDIQSGPELLYQPACHAEWTGVPASRSGEAYAAALARLTGTAVRQTPGCCGESGLGAMTSPEIYNSLRKRKQDRLTMDLAGYDPDAPVLVGCPSCRVGVERSLLALGLPNHALHAAEFLADALGGREWRKHFVQAVKAASAQDGYRLVRVPRSDLSPA